MNKLKVLELFGGIGACSKALKNLGIDYEIVDYVEIDKYAVKSFNAIFNTKFEPQDICTWNKNIDVDLIMHGSPCQDFSLAGKQAGGDEGSGTRSSLMYETLRIVEKLKPKYVIWENVKNVISKKHRHNFDNYLNRMEELGYKNYWQVLNAKDYGIPQNRERVFTISILGNEIFEFPPKQELKLKLKDMLEDEVDEKYYLSENQIQNFVKNDNGNCNPSGKGMNGKVHSGNIAPTITTNKGEGAKIDMLGMLDIKGNESIRRVYSQDGLSPTLTNMQGGNRQPKVMIKNATKKGYQEATDGDAVNLSYPTSDTRRGRVEHQVSQTIQCNDAMGVVIIDDTYGYEKEPRKYTTVSPTLRSGRQGLKVDDNICIRKLTPKECWRLMGFDDEDFEKAEKVNSNTQLYKQAGNSICVSVLEAILSNLLK